MTPAPFPLEAYLARIGWTGPLTPTPATLAALHRHQLFAIPFENLDPLAGRPVSLDAADLVRKLVHARRGGYCFELNGLFLLALRALGFPVRPLCARVLISPENYSIRSHQITLVEFSGSAWLADVGFGGNGLVDPLPFTLDREFDHGLDTFRLVKDSLFGYRLEHRRPAGWAGNYAFSLDPFLPGDFRALNFFVSRSPDSFFTQLPICVRTLPAERRILVANRFKIRRADGSTHAEKMLFTADELRSVLANQFDLRLPNDYSLPDPRPAPPGMREI